MEWKAEYTKNASDDLKNLDKTQQMQVIKAIKKTSENPLPKTEGGYGKPLGNHMLPYFMQTTIYMGTG
ncbi:hypothetical protein [Sedimentibacter sp.]|uniref:type II toxin-antitoxin system RelE family toxin n=1 Tax=Sedimentibacter sp. TaxID=1960295 RepID=UPI000ED681D5|nr:hypothetical protein [Sedimentibacter sp.]HCX61242.1 hypothetical protein [Clostridiales bacterium]